MGENCVLSVHIPITPLHPFHIQAFLVPKLKKKSMLKVNLKIFGQKIGFWGKCIPLFRVRVNLSVIERQLGFKHELIFACQTNR